MKLPRWQHGIGTAALLAWTGSASGQSVDTSMARAVVDQPLAMTVQVRGFDWPATRLTPDCVQVQIQQGESGDTITPVRVRTIPSGDDGRVLVQISSPQVVTDTVLTGRLSLLCGADFTREFTVLVDPPAGGLPPRRTAPHAEQRPPAQPAPAPRTAEPPAPTSRHITRSDDPATTSTATGRAMDEAELQRLVNAVVTALALSTTSTPLAPPAPAAESTTSALSWQDLREEQRQTRASLMALVARIERNERDVWRDAALVMAAVIGLSASLLVLRLIREGLMPRMNATTARTAHRLRRQQAQSRVQADPFATATPPPTPPSSTPAPTAADHGVVDWSPPPTLPTRPRPGSPPTPEPATHIARWPDADFGHPTLDMVHTSTELLRELEPHAADFPVGVAMVLEKRLQAEAGKCPWILLRLLTLYQAMAQPWNHERVAAQLEALYNVHVPSLDPDLESAASTDLEALPDTLNRIEQAWQQDDPAAELAALLLKPTAIEVLPPLAFEEALLLHSIVQQRQSGWLTPVAGSGGSATPMPMQQQASPDRWLDLLAA